MLLVEQDCWPEHRPADGGTDFSDHEQRSSLPEVHPPLSLSERRYPVVIDENGCSAPKNMETENRHGHHQQQ